jgi:hypothetical protein
LEVLAASQEWNGNTEPENRIGAAGTELADPERAAAGTDTVGLASRPLPDVVARGARVAWQGFVARPDQRSDLRHGELALARPYLHWVLVSPAALRAWVVARESGGSARTRPGFEARLWHAKTLVFELQQEGGIVMIAGAEAGPAV